MESRRRTKKIWRKAAVLAAFFCALLPAVKLRAAEATYAMIPDPYNFVKIKCGQTAELVVELLPAGSTSSTPLVWSSSDTSLASVEGHGMKATVKGKTAGYVRISVSNGKGTLTNESSEATVSVVHDWGEDPKWEVIKDATPTEDGIKVLKCAVCGKEAGRITFKYRPAETGKQTEKQTEKQKTEKQTDKKVPQQTESEEVVESWETIEEEEETIFVTLNESKLTLQQGMVSSVLKVKKIGKGDRIAAWTSSDPSIVTVDKNTGELSAVRPGTARIRVKTAEGASAVCKVKVQTGKVGTTKLIVSPKTVTLKKGKTLTLTVQRKPATANDKITYKSSNKKIASVSGKGKVKAKKKGTAKVTVQSASGKTAVVTIKVK